MVASAGLCWRGQTHAFWERVQVSLRQRSGLIGGRSLLNSIDVPGYRSIRVGEGMKRVLGYALADPHNVPKHLRETAVWCDLLAWMLRQRPRMGFLRFELRCIDALGRRRLRGGLRRCRHVVNLAGLPDPRRRSRAEYRLFNFRRYRHSTIRGLLCVTLPKAVFLTGKACTTAASPL
jgi:hypothetical protein